jgi:glycosyltransferase involved in cell wall biosynthesis
MGVSGSAILATLASNTENEIVGGTLIMPGQSAAGKTPKVSVVIPTYNRGSTIKRAVASVLAQGFPIHEVVIVDDGSTDDTLEILSKIKDSRIKVIESPGRSGAPSARNLGVEASSGEWIAFQDSDDYWFGHKLERQFERLAQFPNAVLCYCGLIQYYDGVLGFVPNKSIRTLEGDIYDELLQASFISTQTIVVKKSTFLESGGFRPDMPRLQDWELVLRLAKLGPFCCVLEPLVIAYSTPGNLTSDSRKGANARLSILDIHQLSFSAKPALLARHYHIAAKQFLLTGSPADAVKYFRKATRHNPFAMKSWFWLFVSIFKNVPGQKKA